MGMKNAIGLDIGGTNFRAALVDAEGRIKKKIKRPTEDDVMAAIEEAVKELADRNTAGVGVGVAGLVDREALAVVHSPNLSAITGRGFGAIGGGRRVVMENDAGAAALGELWMGAGKVHQSFVLLTLGTGIGCGVVHKGRLLDAAAEAGHMSIMATGDKCPCGNYGCLELYASARAIKDAATKALEEGAKSALRDCCSGNIYKLTPEDVFTAALDGDPLSRDVLKVAGRHLGVGIANLINLFSPDAVVLMGGLTGAWDIYVEEAIREARRRAFKGMPEIPMVPSALGLEDAGVIGAAGLVLHG